MTSRLLHFILNLTLVGLATPASADTDGTDGDPGPAPSPLTLDTSALEDAAAELLATDMVPNFPQFVEREDLVALLGRRPICGGVGPQSDYILALEAQAGEDLAHAVMNVMATEETYSLVGIFEDTKLLKLLVLQELADPAEVASFLSILEEHAELVVEARTIPLALEVSTAELTQLRTDSAEELRRALIRALDGNSSNEAIEAVGEALQSESAGIRVDAARVALNQEGVPWLEEVEALCDEDIAIVQDIICAQL